MGAESGPQSARLNLRAVEDALRENPTAFGFFQAVRILERLRPDRAGVGHFTDPADEVARFSVHPAIAFPASEIQAVELSDDDPARLTINFFGLTGPLGVLPHHYTLLAAERSRARDGAMRAFLDIFHHRILSLFYRAWEKHRFGVAYEKGEADPVTAHFLDLVGMGVETLRRGLPIAEDTLAYYAGLLAPQQRSAAALEQLIEDYFDVPVEVEQFVGGWHPLPRHNQCALGEEDEGGAGDSARLGLGAVAGDAAWDQQCRVRLRIGPVDRARYEEFLPSGRAYRPLRELTRFFSHDQFEFEVQLVLAGEDVPGCVLGADDAPQPLGWSTWIRSAPFLRDADETILGL